MLDRWALSEAHRLVGDVTVAMESFDTQRAGNLLSAYVDDLSNWYVRRSRRRFWDGDPSAFATLHECLQIVTLMAPLAPFITERVWRDVFAATSADLPESVHLSDWPKQDPALVDADLSQQVKLARRLVELAVLPGRVRRCVPASRCAGPWSRARPTTACPTSCSRRWPRS